MGQNNQPSLLDEIERKKILEEGGDDFEEEMDRIKNLPDENRNKLFGLKEEK